VRPTALPPVEGRLSRDSRGRVVPRRVGGGLGASGGPWR
jgi:hypothetical protein